MAKNKEKEPRERVAFTVTEDMKARLRNIANATGLKMSEIARRGILQEIQELEDQEGFT